MRAVCVGDGRILAFSASFGLMLSCSEAIVCAAKAGTLTPSRLTDMESVRCEFHLKSGEGAA